MNLRIRRLILAGMLFGVVFAGANLIENLFIDELSIRLVFSVIDFVLLKLTCEGFWKTYYHTLELE